MAEGEEHGADYDGAQVSMAGILTLCKGKITKKGAMMGILSLEDLTGQIEGLVFPKVYERYVPLLNVDSLVILDGKLSFREEEEPKLLVDAVRPLDGRNAAQRMAEPLKMASARTEPRRDVRPARGHAPAEAPALTDAQLAKRAGRKLYVLAPSRAEMEGIKAECAAHPGDVPVYVKLKDEGIALLLNRTFWCDGEAETLSRLRGRYGEDGVVLRE